MLISDAFLQLLEAREEGVARASGNVSWNVTRRKTHAACGCHGNSDTPLVGWPPSQDKKQGRCYCVDGRSVETTYNLKKKILLVFERKTTILLGRGEGFIIDVGGGGYFRCSVLKKSKYNYFSNWPTVLS